MKKIILALVFWCVAVTGAFGQSALNNAIKKAAQEMQNELPEGTAVAVLKFNTPSQRLDKYVEEELMYFLTKGKKLKVTERHRLDAIREEIEFQLSGEVSDETIVSIGKKLGAKYVITGALEYDRTIYIFRVYAINIEKGVREVYAKPSKLPINDRRVNDILAGDRPSGNDEITYIEKATVVCMFTTPFYQWGDGLSGFGETLSFHYTLIPFLLLGLDSRFGFMTATDDLSFNFGWTAKLGLMLPLNNNVKLFGEGLYELGSCRLLSGEFFLVGYETGFILLFDKDGDWGFGMDLKYRGSWYPEFIYGSNSTYIHSVGISFGWGGHNWGQAKKWSK